MWNVNLSSLAQKAKEAAARFESQLDDSIGIADDRLFGQSKHPATSNDDSSTAALTGNLAVTHEEVHDDLNEEDDFFSDCRHEKLIAQHNEQQQQEFGHAESTLDGTPTAATKIHIGADEGDDFFGEEDQGESILNSQKTEFPDEEVNFGVNSAVRDGWEDSEDIALEEEEGEVMVEIPSKSQHDSESQKIQTLSTNVDAVDADLSEEDGSMVVISPPPCDIRAEEGNHDLVTDDEPFKNDQQLPQKIQEPLSHEEIVAESTSRIHVVSSDALLKNVSDEVSSNVTMDASHHADEAGRLQYLKTISQLESQLIHREEQLSSKSEQIASLSMQYESEVAKLHQIITETKEEAKKRIIRAKDRIDEMQGKLNDAVRSAEAAGGDSHTQAELIAALRAEGEQLARKHSQMEQSVRSAKAEARELAEQLQIQKDGRETALRKIESLENEIKTLKDALVSARKGESQSRKLEDDLVAAREVSEKQRASNLGLEQQLKELREENKSLKKEVEMAKAGSALESERELMRLRKERDEMLGDLENKLRTSEREANVREDSLRHEVSELRKRWQDAVRRAEDLSMDVQQSTAPLLRQLESTERQNRARAAVWTELETKLRLELEQNSIESEKMSKERNDLRANEKRLQRMLKDKDFEIAKLKEDTEVVSTSIRGLEGKVAKLEEERKHMREEKMKVDRQASESVTKVRNDMMQTVVDSEERHRSQIEDLETELAEERLMRDNLIKQLDALAENVKAIEFSRTTMSAGEQSSSEKEKKLRGTTNQVSILQDTLVGIDSGSDDDEDEEDLVNTQGGSFAAMEQLSQGLKGARLELQALRNQLATSEDTRDNLLAELLETRQAAEKLLLFESKVSELTMEVNLKDMEIQGLREDIADVKLLYRQQLDALLEEKASDIRVNTQIDEDERDAAVVNNSDD